MRLSVSILVLVVGALEDAFLDQFFFAGNGALELPGRSFVILLLLCQLLIQLSGPFRYRFLLFIE